MGKPRLTNDGNVLVWKLPDHSSVLYPEHVLLASRKTKRRGGAPTCCPIFGTMPETDDYAGIKMDQHGQVRQGSKHPIRADEKNSSILSLAFYEPWIYGVRITVSAADDGMSMTYGIEVFRPHTVSDRMPISFGWHPYFVTHEGQFEVTCGSTRCDQDTKDLNEAFFTDEEDGHTATLVVGEKTIIIEAAGAFNRFCIWTDNPEEYICIEPVHGGGGKYSFLGPGERISGTCKVSVL